MVLGICAKLVVLQQMRNADVPCMMQAQPELAGHMPWPMNVHLLQVLEALAIGALE